MTERRKVTRVRYGIEGDQKLQSNEDLQYDKSTKTYYAVKRSEPQSDKSDNTESSRPSMSRKWVEKNK